MPGIFDRIEADLALLTLICPIAGSLGSLFQSADLFLMLLVLRQMKSIHAVLILPPCGKIPALHLNTAAVQHQHVINAGIQQIPVVGDKDEALFLPQIRLDSLS